MGRPLGLSAVNAASSICSHALRTAAGIWLTSIRTAKCSASPITFFSRSKSRSKRCLPARKPTSACSGEEVSRLADRELFQDLDVFRAELTRLFAVDAEALQSDRS